MKQDINNLLVQFKFKFIFVFFEYFSAGNYTFSYLTNSNAIFISLKILYMKFKIEKNLNSFLSE